MRRTRCAAVGQLDAAGQDFGDRGAGAQGDAEALERCVEMGTRLPAHHGARFAAADQRDAQARVALGDLGGRLDAGEAAAAHGHGAAVRRQAGEPGGEVVCRGRAVQGLGMLIGARHRTCVGGAADGVHQVVVGQLGRARGRPYRHRPACGVDARRPAPHELDARARQELGNLMVRQFLSGDDLMHPQPLGEPGRRIDQRDAGAGTPGAAGQADRTQQAGVAAADDDDPVVGAHAQLPCSCPAFGGVVSVTPMGQTSSAARDRPSM